MADVKLGNNYAPLDLGSLAKADKKTFAPVIPNQKGTPTVTNHVHVKKEEAKITSKEGQANKNLTFVDGAKQAAATKEIKIDGIKLAENSHGTTYYPVDGDMEGGPKAKYKSIELEPHTLDNYLANPKAKDAYVAIAVDEHLIHEGKLNWGDKIRIPEMEKKLGVSPIIFKAIDTGAAFTGGYYDSKNKFHPSKKYTQKGLSAIDICAKNDGKFHNKSFGSLTLIKVN
ncbi:MAG: hypothetical protein U0457_11620 [Candidatus Sericytochromatia bacterium]